jgi:endoglucanase
MVILRILILLAFLPLIIWSQAAAAGTERQETPRLARCINLGNMLEAPNEGDWGLVVREAWLPIIAEAGFDTVRIPINWSNHAEREAPYTIDPAFFERIDEVLGWALDAGLQAIINIHHYAEIMERPVQERDRLLALWGQIAERYQDYPDTLIFETLNEPNNVLTTRRWNEYQADVVEVMRRTNPERRIIIGPANWNSLWAFRGLELPENRENLIVTFHNYEPFQFTHQGAEWVDGSDAWLGTSWGTESDYRQLELYFDEAAAQWQEEFGLPMLMGEFGAYSRADMESRLRFTRAMVEKAEANGIGWCYWEFAAGFGIYDPLRREFNELYRALIPESG